MTDVLSTAGGVIAPHGVRGLERVRALPQVITARATTSAAVVTGGDIRTLSPGMEAVAGLQTFINRE